ncbi:MAG: Ig-like domain-containing protein [Pleurocapsa sp.]
MGGLGGQLSAPLTSESYIPDAGFAGEDSYTYVVQDNDGQFS